MRVAIGSVKSSPGVTTTALALASSWPGDGDSVLIACDPAGGDIASYWLLDEDPGLTSFAAATRRPEFAADWRLHTQELPGGQRVVVGPSGTRQARAALSMLAAAPDTLPGGEAASILDCGRLDIDSPALRLWLDADVAVVLIRATVAEVSHLAAWREAAGHRNASVVLAPGGPYGKADVERALSLPVIAELPRDDVAAAVLSGRTTVRARSAKRVGMLPLMRAAHSLAATLLQQQAARQPVEAGR